MFPPLCFVDVTRGEVSQETVESLRELLTDEQYALLDNSIRESDPVVRVRFRIVEWWQGNNYQEDSIILATAQ